MKIGCFHFNFSSVLQFSVYICSFSSSRLLTLPLAPVVHMTSSKLSSGHLISWYSLMWPFCGNLYVTLHVGQWSLMGFTSTNFMYRLHCPHLRKQGLHETRAEYGISVISIDIFSKKYWEPSSLIGKILWGKAKIFEAWLIPVWPHLRGRKPWGKLSGGGQETRRRGLTCKITIIKMWTYHYSQNTR